MSQMIVGENTYVDWEATGFRLLTMGTGQTVHLCTEWNALSVPKALT